MALIVEIKDREKSPFEQEPELMGIYHWNEGGRSMHLHEDRVELNFILSGNSTCSVGSEICHTQPGDILIYDSYVLHDETMTIESQIVAWCVAVTNIKLPGQRINSLLPDGIHPNIPAQSIANDLGHLFPMINHYLQQPHGYTVANSLARTIVCLVYGLIRQNIVNTTQQENFIVQQIQDYIHLHYAENITIADIANSVNASEGYVAHIFKRVTNFSPMQYVLRRRIGKAQSLLIYTYLPLTDIAARVGYEDSNYFSRMFKKLTNMPPNVYRQRWLEISKGSTPSEI